MYIVIPLRYFITDALHWKRDILNQRLCIKVFSIYETYWNKYVIGGYLSFDYLKNISLKCSFGLNILDTASVIYINIITHSLLMILKGRKAIVLTWWRHQMVTVSALLALCAGNSPVTGEFHSQRPLSRSFDVFFHLRQNRDWWFETPSRPLWRHCNEYMYHKCCHTYRLGCRFASIKGARVTQTHWSRNHLKPLSEPML